MKIKISEEDRLFSLMIRCKANWTCEKCLRNHANRRGNLQNSHYHGRRKKSVRFDEDNCSALCFTCHQYFTENPYEHTLWMKKKLGENRFEVLMMRANLFEKPDLKMIRMLCRHEIKQMGYAELL